MTETEDKENKSKITCCMYCGSEELEVIIVENADHKRLRCKKCKEVYNI